MCTFGLSDCRVKPRRHPERDKKSENGKEERKNKSDIWAVWRRDTRAEGPAVGATTTHNNTQQHTNITKKGLAKKKNGLAKFGLAKVGHYRYISGRSCPAQPKIEPYNQPPDRTPHWTRKKHAEHLISPKHPKHLNT